MAFTKGIVLNEDPGPWDQGSQYPELKFLDHKNPGTLGLIT